MYIDKLVEPIGVGTLPFDICRLALVHVPEIVLQHFIWSHDDIFFVVKPVEIDLKDLCIKYLCGDGAVFIEETPKGRAPKLLQNSCGLPRRGQFYWSSYLIKEN